MWKCCLKGLLLISGRMCCVGLRYSVLFRFAIWEVLIFNTSFIYIHDFDLAECHVSILKSQNKHDISIVTHSWVTKEMCDSLIVLSIPTSMALHVPTCWEGVCPLKPAQVYCLFQSSLCWWHVFYASDCLRYIYIALCCPCLLPAPHGLASSAQHPCYQERLFAQATATAEGLKQRSPSSPNCVKVSFLYDN